MKTEKKSKKKFMISYDKIAIELKILLSYVKSIRDYQEKKLPILMNSNLDNLETHINEIILVIENQALEKK